MGDLKDRIRATFRRLSTTSSLASLDRDGATSTSEINRPPTAKSKPRSLKSQTQRPGSKHTNGGATIAETVDENEDGLLEPRDGGALAKALETSDPPQPAASRQPAANSLEVIPNRHDSTSTADFPTPTTDILPVPEEGPEKQVDEGNAELQSYDTSLNSASTTKQRPAELTRQQSLLPHQQTSIIQSLLGTEEPEQPRAATLETSQPKRPSIISANMVKRKIWVKRPGASATLVTIHEDDLVDDVRDMILRKYANSLGRSFDAPDVTLRLIPRENRQERTLGPEEEMVRTLDSYYPGGQSVDDALVIDVPLRRTPKASPQPSRPYYDDGRPLEGGTDYFPPMPIQVAPSPQLHTTLPATAQPNGHPHHIPLPQHSMSVLTTGQVPALPSPSSRRPHLRDRPRIGRQHTSSPTVISSHTQHSQQPPTVANGTQLQRVAHSRTHSSASETSTAPPAAPPIPTPPAPPQNTDIIPRVTTPPPRVSSPRPKAKKSKKTATDHPKLPSGTLNAVPAINVLIVEDNIINLKLLEAFMKRLKVRWQTAMNGKEAVTKWRGGGFHLVLMDIQLPIMSGLEATKEIRRLERLNSIGVFGSSVGSDSAPSTEGAEGGAEGEDRLPRDALFKSPVIIVALTASSLQSDRHEALAAGCNDFLTKVSLALSKALFFLITPPLYSMNDIRRWFTNTKNSR